VERIYQGIEATTSSILDRFVQKELALTNITLIWAGAIALR